MVRAIAASLCFVASTAIAQTNNATSESSTTSNSTANNSGNSQSLIVQGSPGTVNYGGSYTLRNTGVATLPGFSGSFSSDYCGGTTGAAAAGVGFGLSFGVPKIDPSCVMLRTFERTMQAAASERDPERSTAIRQAALEILSKIDPVVRDTFARHGLIDQPSILRTTP